MNKKELNRLKRIGKEAWADKGNGIDASWTAHLQNKVPDGTIINPRRNYLRHFKRHEDEK